MKTYKIEITYLNGGHTEIIELKTSDLKKSMDQYCRNRAPLDWKVLD